MQGSYVVSGACLARADKIAEANYIEGLTSRARKYKKPRSQLLGGLKIILKVVAVIIILMIYFMWQTNYTTFLASGLNSDEAFIRALTNTAGSVIGMIPAGSFPAHEHDACGKRYQAFKTQDNGAGAVLY